MAPPAPQTEDVPRQRILKRAANLLTPSGQVIQQLNSPPTEHSTLTRGGLRLSLKKKFSQVKERSKSLGLPFGRSSDKSAEPKVARSNTVPRPPVEKKSIPPLPAAKHNHGRSYSESLAVRPEVPHRSTASGVYRRFSAKASVPLPNVLEPHSPVPPNATEEPPDLFGIPGLGDVSVPVLLQQGTPMTKVSAKKHSKVILKLDPDQGHILWKSKVLRTIPIETIKELRSGPDARYYREQFGLAADYEVRWLTIIYIMDGNYKTLHLIAATAGVHRMWDTTLRQMHGVRVELMSGLGNVEIRERVWERAHWKGRVPAERPEQANASTESKGQLDFADVEKLCLRLGVSSAREDLERLFTQADTQNRHYLDFTDFQRFVKLLKKRPEVIRLYKYLQGSHPSGTPLFDYGVFENFMRETQKSTLPSDQLRVIFEKYASAPVNTPTVESPPILPPIAVSPFSGNEVVGEKATPPIPVIVTPSEPAELALTLDQFTSFLLSPHNAAFSDRSPSMNGLSTPQHGASSPPRSRRNSTDGRLSTPIPAPPMLGQNESLTAAAVNATPCLHDMTRPLSEYYISSSHNTYLVGHQLVGISTIEGYIRALLQGCRSVEIDIYDGDFEPMIFHGKTFTSKVSLREVCQAIKKYGFVASPYPLIISAEIHCGLAQQQLIVDIMVEVFGDALVRAPNDAIVSIEGTEPALPSPEALKNRILLKAKNLYIGSETEAVQAESDTSTSSTSASASESEGSKVKAKGKELKHEFQRARSVVIHRVRSGRRPSSSSTAPTARPQLLPPPNGSATLAPPSPSIENPKVKMCPALVSLLVYTVGVKCRGINKKEEYAPEHIFSLSENMATKMLRQGTGAQDLIKHNKTHLVRVYPKGLRLSSTNYEPQRYWACGFQLVALNWQTFDLGYMINHAMFQRNGRTGYVLKPMPLRFPDKIILSKRTQHSLDLEIISAQQLPRPKNAAATASIDPYVEVSVHVPPEWTSRTVTSPTGIASPTGGAHVLTTYKTCIVKNNGFNPVWQEPLTIPFECIAGMLDLVFVRLEVRQGDKEDDEPLAVYCASLGSLQSGFRHLALHDAQMSQYLYSTLFVKVGIRDVTVQ